jgi:phenylpyruvate tautomerase PptA (4-oxalocrotonate tautomerase family)
MPYLKIQTNLPVSRAAETAVVQELTALLMRELQRPSETIAIAVESDTRLFLAGADDPAAFVEVASAHLPPQGRAFGEALANLLHQHLGMPASHVYVKFVSSAAFPHRRAA